MSELYSWMHCPHVTKNSIMHVLNAIVLYIVDMTKLSKLSKWC